MVDYWLKNKLVALLPQPCLLCGDIEHTGHDLALCKACLGDLPILGETCLSCANPMESGFERLEGFLNTTALLQTRLCGQCILKQPYFDHSLAFFPYVSPFDYLIHAMKFQGKLAVTKLLGQLMAEQINHTLAAFEDLPDGLLPVPLHASRQQERGYNQSLELARPISKQLQIPVLNDLAQRVKATPPQSSLSLKQRTKNLHNAFITHYSIKDRHIAIIDDVMTTGTTVNTLAKKLKQAGARRISVWCFCRAEPPS